MDIRTALEAHVRKRLEDSFGKAVAMLIWASANTKSGISSVDPDRDGYMRFIGEICSDQRVRDMWGASGTEHALNEWKLLV